MTPSVTILLLLAGLLTSFLLSALITAAVRLYSRKHRVLDTPNERSSHSMPTPTGGGLSISLVFISGLCLLYLWNLVPMTFAVALGGGGLLVAITGWIDDHRDVSAMLRVISYFLAALWSLIWLGGLEHINLGIYEFQLPLLLNVLAVVSITWLTNLYNFMDGTDGLAGVQAVSTTVPAGIIFWVHGEYGAGLICLVLLGSSLGFLLWNWPPARIFMGDVGSCLLGFLFACLAIFGEKTGSLPILVWIILLAVFIGDATLTLFQRMINGERWYSAHRSHAYQLSIQLGASHKQLALSVLFINIIVLWPLAFLAYKYIQLTVYMAVLAVILVAGVWMYIHKIYAKSRIKKG